VTTAKFKRFYAQASWAAAPAESGQSGVSYRVLLDGKAVKTPAKAEMALPYQALAEAIAAEWQAQGEDVEVRTLVLTGLAWTANDRVGPGREGVVDELAGFGAHDAICYHAETPADLIARQRALWQPLVDWAADTLGAPLAVTSGIVSIEQPSESLAALRRAVGAWDDFELTALSAAASAAGSLVIGLALAAGRLDAAAAFDAAQLDESYQIERWGEDPEAADRRAAIKADLETAARFLALLRA
jgi:chaperone required for assembly of F1-ATPase